MSTGTLDPTASLDLEFRHLVDELTRRGLFAGGIGAAALLALAACGSPGAGDDDATSPSPSTRRVSTIHGDVDVPADPRRVVTVTFVGTANLLDVGVTPVGGVTAGVDFLPRYQAALGSMPIVADSAGKVELEKIASLEPDLIVGSDWPDAAQALLPYDELRRIAPTALFEQGPSVGNWADQAHGYADAVNRLDRLAPLREKFLATQQSIAATYATLLGALRWEVINAAQDAWYRYSPAASHCTILGGAGFRFTEASTAQRDSFAKLSYEQLGQLRAASAIGLGRAVNPTWQTSLTSQQLYTRLPAVENGHVVNLTWFFPSSYGTAQALLEQVEPALAQWQNS